MGKTKRKNRADHLAVMDRFAVHYGRCDDFGDPIDEPLSPFEFGKEIRQRLCRHWRQPVEVAQETVVHASAYMDRPRTEDWSWPDVGVYLSPLWADDIGLTSYHWTGPIIGPHSEIAMLPCPDGGVPPDVDETERVLAYALHAARARRFVEIGCHAGHGRTGMALAALMILGGLTAEQSIERTYDFYCEWAIETQGQERYLFELSRRPGRQNR